MKQKLRGSLKITWTTLVYPFLSTLFFFTIIYKHKAHTVILNMKKQIICNSIQIFTVLKVMPANYIINGKYKFKKYTGTSALLQNIKRLQHYKMVFGQSKLVQRHRAICSQVKLQGHVPLTSSHVVTDHSRINDFWECHSWHTKTHFCP